MTESKFLFGGVFYDGEQKAYSGKHEFRFTDIDGKTYKNSFDFEDVEFIHAPKSVSKEANLELELSRPVLANERIILSAQSDTSKSNSVQIGNDPQESAYYDLQLQRLIIKPEFFMDFADVPSTIWLEKEEIKKPLDQPTNLGGELHFTFQSREINVRRLGKVNGVKDEKNGVKL